MKKGIKLFLLFEVITILIACSGGLKDPLKASELSGSLLDNFLNSSFDYGPAEHTDTIKEVFYSGNQGKEYQISNPRNIGKQDGDAYIALVITKNDISIDKYNTINILKIIKVGISTILSKI
jgi:hypothetical protein